MGPVYKKWQVNYLQYGNKQDYSIFATLKSIF